MSVAKGEWVGCLSGGEAETQVCDPDLQTAIVQLSMYLLRFHYNTLRRGWEVTLVTYWESHQGHDWLITPARILNLIYELNATLYASAPRKPKANWSVNHIAAIST